MIRTFKKCGLYVLLFALLSIGLFLGFSDNANAYDPDTQILNLCRNHPTPPANFPRIREGTFDDFAGMTPSGDINNENASFMFLSTFPDTTSSGTNNLIYTIDDGFYFREHPTVSGEIVLAFDIPTSQTGRYRKNKYSPYTVTYQNFVPPSSPVDMFSSHYPTGTYADADFAYETLAQYATDLDTPNYDGNCIHLWQNITSKLPPELYEKLQDDLKTDNNEYFPPDCGILEFTCWLPQIFDGLTDALLTLGEGIVKAITWLFIPNTDGLNTRLQNIVDTMADRLGILWLPNDLLIHYFELFVTGDPLNWTQPNNYNCSAFDYSGNNPYGSIVSLFGESVILSDIIPYCKALGIGGNYGTLTTYINYLIVFFRLSLLMAVLRLFYKKIHEEIII